MRRKKTARKVPKAKIIFDEGLPPRKYFPQLNNFFSVKHIKQDLGFSGLLDPEVYEVANFQKRVLVTFNSKHFRSLVEKDQVTIIGLSTKMTYAQVDSKLTSFLKKLTEKELIGNFFEVSNETKING